MVQWGGHIQADQATGTTPASAAVPPGQQPAANLTSAASAPMAMARLLLERSRASLSQSEPRPPLDALRLFRASLVREYHIVETPENDASIASVVAQAWDSLRPDERAPFESRAAEDAARYAQELRSFRDMQAHFQQLQAVAAARGIILPPEGSGTAMPEPPQIEQQQPLPQLRPAATLPAHHGQQQVQQQVQQHGWQQDAWQQKAALPAPPQRTTASMPPATALQVAQLQRAAQIARQKAAAAAAVMEQQATLVAEVEQRLRTLEHDRKVNLDGAQAAVARLPAPLGPALLTRSQEAITAAYQQRRTQLQKELEQAEAAGKAASQVHEQQQAAAAAAERQLQQQGLALQTRQQPVRPQPTRLQQLPAALGPRQEQQTGQMQQSQEPGLLAPRLPEGVPQMIEVSCQHLTGTMDVLRQTVLCKCGQCAQLPLRQRVWTCPQWETHAGALSAKKWKTSLRVQPGGAPGVSAHGNGMTVLKWLEANDVNFSRPMGGQPARLGRSLSDAAARQPPVKTYVSRRLSERRRRAAALARRAAQESDESDEYESSEESDENEEQRSDRNEEARQRREHAAEPHSQRVATSGGGSERDRQQPWLEVQLGCFEPIRVRYSGERCCVCDVEGDFDFDQLVCCDLCGLAVHQSCYGVMELPGPDEMWLCRTCELKEEGGPPPQCCVCPCTGGALKPTTMHGVWCHSACQQWIPEITVLDVERQEPVDIQSIPRDRWNLVCCLCRQRMGAKIQCAFRDCCTAYHPLCARLAGFLMEIQDGPGGEDSPMVFLSYCARHAKPQPHLSGCRLVSESEERGDLPDPSQPQEGAGLHNGQPYPLPPQASLPACPAGAARAMPLLRSSLQRGGGRSDDSRQGGWWIPGPPAADQPRKRQRAAGRAGPAAPGSSHAAAGKSPADRIREAEEDAAAEETAAAAGAEEAWWCEGKQGSPVGAASRQQSSEYRALQLGDASRHGQGGRSGRTSDADREPVRASDSDSDEVEDSDVELVDLLPLPPGVPEQLPVWCNGHNAILILRTQRVVFEGNLMKASEFEQLTGSANAGTWRQSLYHVAPDGKRTMISTWLTQHELNRKIMSDLSRNARQLAAWHRHTQRHVESLLNEMVQAVGADGAPAAAAAAVGSPTASRAAAPRDGTALHPPAVRVRADGQAQQAAQPAAASVVKDRPAVGPACAGALPSGNGVPPSPEQPDSNHISDWMRGEMHPGRHPAGAAAAAAGHREQQADDPSPPRQQQQQQAANGSAAKHGAAATLHLKPPLQQVAPVNGVAAQAKVLPNGKVAGRPSAGAPLETCLAGQTEAAAADIQQQAAGLQQALAPASHHKQDEEAEAGKPSNEGRQGLTPGAPAIPNEPGSGLLGQKRSFGQLSEGDEEEAHRINRPRRSGSGGMESDSQDGGSGEPGGVCVAGVPAAVLEGAWCRIYWPEEDAWLDCQVREYAPVEGLHRVLYERDLEDEWLDFQQEHCLGRLQLLPGPDPSSWPPPPPRPSNPEALVPIDEAGTSAGAAGDRDGGSSQAASGSREMDAKDSEEGVGSGSSERGSGKGAPLMQDGVCGALRGPLGASTLPIELRSGQRATPHGAPRRRDGKQAYLRALPQLATAGPTPHQLPDVPLSRCWMPEDWAAHRLRQAARAAAASGGGPTWMRAADLAPVVATNPAAYADSLAPRVSVGPGTHDERPLSVKEKLELCHATEHARIAFGKSGIHGWGLFARAPVKQDSMVTEYRGVLLRASVAEARERRYRSQGRDCFLFNLDDQHVLDSTEAGALCRFTNHSCAPSMYSKILNVGGRQRLVFFARHDIQAGQELTYNYRFERQEGEERLPCLCGAPTCCGYLN